MRRHPALLTADLLAVALAARVWAQPPGQSSREFQGYWMGVDPLDGGDSRRSFILQANGDYTLAGRDSVHTLCDAV
jgi:hypothetical protein